jgi:methyl-accepting chemotaxis protein
MPQSPGIAALMTRQKTNMTIRSQKELKEAEGQNMDVRLKEQAIDFLMVKQYLIPSNTIDLQALAYVLLQIGSAATRGQIQLADGIRAVAFLLANASTQKIADEISKMVKNQIQEHIENFTSGVENMRDTVEHVTTATKTMTGKIDEVKDGLQETTEKLTQATQELTEKTAESTNKATTDQVFDPQPMTYAVAMQQEAHADHAEVIMRGHTMDKQILIQKDKDATDNALDSLTEKDLVVKANTTLDLMGMAGMDKPRHTSFIRAKKL